jgi:hypothetical protein
MSAFSPGRRWFAAANVAMIVVALLHTLGNTLSGPPPDATYPAVEAAMRGYVLPLGLGMTPSIWDILRSLTFTMSVSFAMMGALGLVIGASPDATPRLGALRDCGRLEGRAAIARARCERAQAGPGGACAASARRRLMRLRRDGSVTGSGTATVCRRPSSSMVI